jgi:hypothetical protein
MARADLSAMLGRLDRAAPATDSAVVREQPATARVAPKPTRRKPSPWRESRPPLVEGGGGYLSFERKESRLRPDQYATPTQEARRLDRAREAPESASPRTRSSG